MLTPDGPHFLEGGRSVPIGASDPAVFREASAVLPPGSSLLLYTDGLVERRDVGLEERLGQLAEVAGAAGDDLEALCERVIQVVLGDGDPGDDVALLAVRPLPAASERISLTLPAEPGSLAGLRRRLARFLHATGASEAEQYELTLTICEAAGNAIEHAYGPGDATFEVEVTFVERRARGHGPRQRQLARQARRAPRARPQHHRGADGRGSGVGRRRTGPW